MKMEQRPKIKIEWDIIDKIIEGLGWAFLLLLWYITISSFSSLPAIIPTHFNASGKIDDYGSRSTLFLLPAIGTLIFVGMTFLNRFPHTFNYLSKITEENARRQYTLATKMMRYLKMIVLVIFSALAYITSTSASGKTDGPGVWFFLVLVGSIFAPLIIFITKMAKAK